MCYKLTGQRDVQHSHVYAAEKLWEKNYKVAASQFFLPLVNDLRCVHVSESVRRNVNDANPYLRNIRIIYLPCLVHIYHPLKNRPKRR